MYGYYVVHGYKGTLTSLNVSDVTNYSIKYKAYIVTYESMSHL
jgi:hypothetical protein